MFVSSFQVFTSFLVWQCRVARLWLGIDKLRSVRLRADLLRCFVDLGYFAKRCTAPSYEGFIRTDQGFVLLQGCMVP